MEKQPSEDWQDHLTPPQDEVEKLDKFDADQKEKFADAANIQSILEGFKSFGDTETQDEFVERFNEVRDQLKPYFEKYELPEPACFKDIEVGDTISEKYYDTMLAGYGLLREKLSR